MPKMRNDNGTTNGGGEEQARYTRCAYMGLPKVWNDQNGSPKLTHYRLSGLLDRLSKPCVKVRRFRE